MHMVCVMCHQLLLQKEREDITALYKSVQSEQPKQNVATTSTAQELASHGNSPLDRISALQSAYTHPVATECGYFQERSSPTFTTGVERVPVSVSSVGIVALTGNHVTHALSRQMSDAAASLAGAYHSFQNTDDTPAVLHRSLDSSFPSASKSKDLLPQYLTKHSFPNADGSSARSVSASASSGAVNTLQTLSESMNDSMNAHRHPEFRAAFPLRGMSDEAVHNYGNISGINFISFIIFRFV